MSAIVGVPTLQDPDLQDLEGNFLEGFIRHNAEALWQNTHEAAEAAWWFFKSGKSSKSSFPNLCAAFGVEPDVIRREVMRELHRQNIMRIYMREPRWQKTASWYKEQDKGAFPFDCFVAFIRISKPRLQQEASSVIANPYEFDFSNEETYCSHAA